MSKIKRFREWIIERTTGDGWEPTESWVHGVFYPQDLEVGRVYTWSDRIGTSRRVKIVGMKRLPETDSWQIRFRHVDNSIQPRGSERSIVLGSDEQTSFEH